MALYIGQIPPETPLTGDFWLDASDGKAKRFDSSKWVEIENSTLAGRVDTLESKVEAIFSVMRVLKDSILGL